MKRAYFRFYAELNDFFPPEEDGKVHVHYFKGKQSVKDRIESLGVPHPEVYLIVVNGEAVDFSYHVQDEDQINVYPVFKSVKLTSKMAVRVPYQGDYSFVLDVHLGKLARYLRMLGFDVWYDNEYSDLELAEISAEEGRILLTRDHGLLKRKKVVYGYFVRCDDPKKQLYSVLKRYDLFDEINSLGRCIECNAALKSVNKEKVLHRLEPRTKKYYNEFYLCPVCSKVYWKGSHYRDMKQFIKEIKNNFTG